MKIKKLSIILFYILFWANISVAEIFIYAIVRDINTHRKIRNVNIFIKGTKVGTTSDAAGRFSLKVAQSTPGQIVVFRHIGYEIYEVPLDSLATMRYVYLQPRVIPLQPVEVEGAGIQGPEIQKDLPQHVSIIEAKDFEIRGYVDAADLLRTDHSIQIDEQLSGKKTVSIRGGNPDEVAVMFNGIKMNSSYNNVFDFSLIDLEDVERFEIIKGSNTALYGSETFSGVINIVPKIEQDYTVRFQQRLGTYRSGNWGLHFYKRLNRLLGSYSFKRGGAERNFRNALPGRQKLTNTSLHHTANLSFSFSRDTRNLRRNLLSAMYLFTDLDYENQRDSEYLASFNHLLSLQYAGDLFKIRNLDLSVSLRRLDETQFLASGSGLLERNIDERTLQIDTEKRFKLNRLDLLFAYQVKIAHLDFVDIRKNFNEEQVGLESSDLRRNHHGFVSILKYHGPTGSDFLNSLDLDVSLRHDIVQDEQLNPVSRNGSTGIFNSNDWQDTLVKFAARLHGQRNDLMFESYFTYGSNTKFPTLLQQISIPNVLTGIANQANLNPETSRSLEISTTVTMEVEDHRSINGWEISASYFQNLYDNKFRIFTVPGFPVPFYDNAPTARITGLEGESNVFLLKKKVTFGVGLSRYFISDKNVFPFKSDFKGTLNLNIDHAGYALQIFLFKEGEQVALVRKANSSTFDEIPLRAYTNLDVHLSKRFEISKIKLFANVSGRNLLRDDDTELSGLTIRDRRFYMTVGAQY